MQTLLKDTGSAFMKDTVFLLKNDPDFLGKSAEGREKVIFSSLGENYPKSLVNYLVNLSAAKFKQEFEHVIQVLEGVAQPDQRNTFLNALSDFFAKEMGAMLDTMPLNFFFKTLNERLNGLNQILPQSSALGVHLKQWLSESTYQELTAAAHQALETLKNAPVVVVQTPLEIDEGMRTEIREHFSKKHPHAFVEFQINPKILGGMRLFVNGEVDDRSWLAKVQNIARLRSLESV